MNNFLKLAKKRRSIRNFKDKKITDKDIKKIIEAGIWAPSAWNEQQCKFIILKNTEVIKIASEEILKIRKKISKKPLREVDDPIFYNAPIVVLICTEKNSNEYSQIDVALCAQNCLLMSEDMGISSCIIGQVKFLNQNSQIINKLSIPKNWQVILGFCLGYKKESVQAPNRNKSEIIFIK